jgi:hypothetical protein
MKIKLLLLSAFIALATTTAASADSDHRYKDQRNQNFGHVEHRDHRAVDRHNNRLFSFSLIVPGPSYYMPHRYDNHHDYRRDYRYRNDYKHHNNKHHNRHSKHRDRDHVQGFRR